MILTNEDMSAISNLMDEKLEKFDLLKILPIRTDIEFMKADIKVLKTDVAHLKSSVDGLRTEIDDVKYEIGGIKRDIHFLRNPKGEIPMRVDE